MVLPLPLEVVGDEGPGSDGFSQNAIVKVA